MENIKKITFQFEFQEDELPFTTKFEPLLNKININRKICFKIINYPKNIRRKLLFSGKI